RTRVRPCSAPTSSSAGRENEMTRAHAGVALTAVLLGGSVTGGGGDQTQLQSQYQLVDTKSPTAATARRIGRELLISPLPGNSLDDSFALTYSRRPQQRTASWERCS